MFDHQDQTLETQEGFNFVEPAAQIFNGHLVWATSFYLKVKKHQAYQLSLVTKTNICCSVNNT
jgi:hypothetical protein